MEVWKKVPTQWKCEKILHRGSVEKIHTVWRSFIKRKSSEDYQKVREVSTKKRV